MYDYYVTKSVEKLFFKLAKRDRKMLKFIEKKILEIVQNPNHYKNLRNPLQHLKRVHIGKSYVLCFSVDEGRRVVVFEKFDHHDRIYL